MTESCCGGGTGSSAPDPKPDHKPDPKPEPDKSRGRAVVVQITGVKPEPTPVLPCLHRGRVPVGRADCPECRGKKVTLFVYECRVFGRCTLRTRVADASGCCHGCPKRLPPPAPPSASGRA